jgi:hypothetical protein
VLKIEAAAERRILLGLASFAMAWAIARARIQAITIDEAATIVNFALPADPTFLRAHANNHILNSLLAKMFIRVFGASNLSVRGGALIGAAIFILASYFLSALVTERFLLRVSLFICLVFNPLVFDFLVAARGYGLASGFLLSAVCLVAYALKPDEAKSPLRACALASLCIALSFVSNFSFALVDAAAMGLLYLWASAGGTLKIRAQLAAACFLPGLLLAGGLAGFTLLHWEQGQLTFGAAHLSETFKSLYEASFYELKPSVRDLIFIDVPGIVLSMFGVLVLWRAALILIHWRSLRKPLGRWTLAFATVPAVAVAASVALHWILFRVLRIPLPLDRTAIYIVVLLTLALGGLAAVPISTRAGEITASGLTVLMVVLASYFLLCLRLNHFKEWKWDRDTDKIYSVLAGYNHACGLKDIAVNWRYDAAFNYYRKISGRETFPEFASSLKYAVGKRAYVVYQPEDQDFLTGRDLKVVYKARSGAVIALDPAIKPSAGESACPLTPPAK